MNMQRHPLGAAPVGRVLDLPELEQRVVIYLRLWFDGAPGRSEVRRDLIDRQGPARAEGTLACLDDLFRQTVRFARRPLQRHAAACPCAGGDECVLARFVAVAASGAREEAILMACLLVRADLALALTRQAEDLGMMLMRGGTATARPVH